MHPFFAYMQMVGVYDIEQRCGQRLIAESRLPCTVIVFASNSKYVPPELRQLQQDLLKLHPVADTSIPRGLLTYLVTYDSYLDLSPAEERESPVAITKGAHILRISHITRLDTFLEPRFTDAHIRHRTVKSVRWATL